MSRNGLSANTDTLWTRFLVILFLGFIPVDMLNGILLRSGLPSVSIAYKFFVLALVFVYLMKNHRFPAVFALLSFIVAYWVVHTCILSGEVLSALNGLDWLIKFIAFLFFYLFLSLLIQKDKSEKLFLIATVAFWTLVFNIFMGAMGIGFPMYRAGEDAGIGTRGLIYAGNELGTAVITSGSIVMMKYLTQNRYGKFTLVGMVMLTVGGLMTSKISIAGSLILFICFPFIKLASGLKRLKLQRKAFVYVNSFLLLVPFLGGGVVYYALYQSNLIERISYFYEKYDILTFLLSRRNIWANEAIYAFLNKYSLFEVLFGSGFLWFNYIPSNKMVEIDFIDFLMAYGIFGLLISYGFALYILGKSMISHSNIFSPYIAFALFLLIGISCTAGHVFNSGTAGFLIAILLALSNYKSESR